MRPLKLEDFRGPAATVMMIIGGLSWMDARHEAAGSADRARLEAKIYAANIEVGRLTGTRYLYDAREIAQEPEGLSVTDTNRRLQIISDIQNMVNESMRFQAQLEALD